MKKINVTFRSLLVEWLCTDKPDQYPLWFSRRKRKWGRKTPWSLDLMIRHLASFRQRPWPLNSAPTYVYHRSFFLILSWSTSANLSARWRRIEGRKEERVACSIHDLVDPRSLDLCPRVICEGENFARRGLVEKAELGTWTSRGVCQWVLTCPLHYAPLSFNWHLEVRVFSGLSAVWQTGH